MSSIARIAGDARDDLDAHALVVVAQNPRFAGEVEFAKNVDAVRADAGDVARANEFVNRLARGAVAVLFRAFETFGMNAENGNAGLLGNPFADGAHVIADESDDAGRVDERGFGLVMRDKFEQRGFELFLAAEDHVHFLQVGGKTVAMQLRSARQRAANVPGVSCAANRPVDDVQRVGDRIQHHARTAEHAGALADGAGGAGLAARHVGDWHTIGLAHNLRLTFWKEFNHDGNATSASLRLPVDSIRSMTQSSSTRAPRLW